MKKVINSRRTTVDSPQQIQSHGCLLSSEVCGLWTFNTIVDLPRSTVHSKYNRMAFGESHCCLLSSEVCGLWTLIL
jgi:hypothetical protein